MIFANFRFDLMIRHCDAATLQQIKALVTPFMALHSKTRSDRLAELGFALRQTASGTMLLTLPHKLPVCVLS